MNRLLSVSLLSVTLAAAACSGGAAPDDTMMPDGQPTVDYHHDAVAVLNRYCTSCHTAGGIAPFALTDYASAKLYAQTMKSAVQSGVMPPWMPSDASMPLKYSRKMRAEDRDLLLRWIDSGTPEGDPSALPRTDIPPAEVVAPPRADAVFDPGQTYQPDNSRSDDYHCFVFDPKLTADTFIQAGTIVPGNQAIVHHVLIYEIRAADAPTIQKLNVSGNGYTCFGGPSGSGTSLSSQGRLTTVFAWVPGSVPARFPDGAALRLHAGSLLVMQVHYNTLAANGKGDRSLVQLELNATAPEKELRVIPFANPMTLSLKAGDPNAKQVVTAPVALVEQLTGLPSGDLIVYANSPHMHLLGKRLITTLAGKTMVEIPRWDFHWQQSYAFTTPVIAHVGDSLQIECDYDNSFANQPYVNGQQSSPRDVSWGESTLDEMCLTYLTVTPNK